MERKRTVWAIIAALVVLFAVGCHDDETEKTEIPAEARTTTTVNIDVILPAEIRTVWQPSIDWALDNIAAAQKNLSSKIVLNLRYHDEDTEDLDRLAYNLTHPEEGGDTCHAIIGPYYSAHASTILRYAGRNRMPIVMPTCTSAELQRTNARYTYAWFLTESDITQCEMMVSSAANANIRNVALIYSDDTYGQSFRDWFGYYATEQQCNVVGLCEYKPTDNLNAFIQEVATQCGDQKVMFCFALSNARDYARASQKIYEACADLEDLSFFFNIHTIFADVAYDELVVSDDNLIMNYGIAPTSSPVYGFTQAYEAKYECGVLGGFAQVYDALTIIALGAAHMQDNGDNCLVNGLQVKYTEAPFLPGLTDHMRSVVSCKSGPSANWDVNGLTLAFSEIAAGHDVNLTGATGSLNFDEETYTKILNTTYLLWTRKYDRGKEHFVIEPLVYLSTEGTSTQASTTTLWQMDNKLNQKIDDISTVHQLPDVTDRWAVVISPSTSWANYRHQADAFAMYQLLRSHGYDDDHIILIVEDNLADDEHNIYPGQIFVERSDESDITDIFVNDNVKKNAVVDYHFSDLTPDDISDIMLGRRSDRLQHVISPSSGSDVLFFWSGHGGSNDGPLWGNEDARQSFGAHRIRDIVQQMDDADMYRRMLFAIETCYSGKWGKALEGLPDVLILTAATDIETSKADIYNRDLGVYLSNAFARTFRRQIHQNNDITIYNLYRELFKTTKGSHVSLYNQQNYGSVYNEKMSEFLE